MGLVLRFTAAAALVVATVAGCRATPGGRIEDHDRDGLDDHLEAVLAAEFLPALHEVGAAGGEGCAGPSPRPILYRARPRVSRSEVDLDSVAITYVLLYAEDCGPLGHPGDDEAFTVFLHRENRDRWRVTGAAAVAHRGTPGERRSVGDGQGIWISLNKHSPYATFEACTADDWFIETCARDGPPPPAVTLVNVGEPHAPLSDDVGDAYPPFRGQSIWKHREFLGAGDITAQLFIGPVTVHLPATQLWDAEDPSQPPIVVK